MHGHLLHHLKEQLHRRLLRHPMRLMPKRHLLLPALEEQLRQHLPHHPEDPDGLLGGHLL